VVGKINFRRIHPFRIYCCDHHLETEGLLEMSHDLSPDEKQNGSGLLVLKDGTAQQVQWELDHSARPPGRGRLHADEERLAAAARDGSAILWLAADIKAAIAIESCDGGVASFTVLLFSATSVRFDVHHVVTTALTADGTRTLLELSNAASESLIVSFPTDMLIDYLPTLEQLFDRPSSAKHSLIRIPEKWRTAIARTRKCVVLVVDDDRPIGFSPEDARELAGELINGANKIEERRRTAH
jgi:hypothetical protein